MSDPKLPTNLIPIVNQLHIITGPNGQCMCGTDGLTCSQLLWPLSHDIQNAQLAANIAESVGATHLPPTNEATPTPRTEALEIATLFHDTYERLAPSFGYETRKDTKKFDPETPNGRLMIAVCSRVTADLAQRLAEAERLANQVSQQNLDLITERNTALSQLASVEKEQETLRVVLAEASNDIRALTAQRDAALAAVEQLRAELARKTDLHDQDGKALMAAQSELAQLREELARGRDELAQESLNSTTYLAVLEKIRAIRWGNDGDCGVNAIIDKAI